MSDSELNMVGLSDFNKTCIDIIEMIQKERQKPQKDNGLITMCGDMNILLEEAKRHGLLMMQNVDIGCIPTFVLLCKAGEGLMVPVMLQGLPKDDASRYNLAASLSAVINLAPVDAYFFIAELWMATYDSKQVDLMPSQREDRKEVLMISAYMRDKTEIRIFDIIRSDTKEKTAIQPMAGVGEMADMVAQNPCLKNLFDHADNVSKFMREMAELNKKAPSEWKH